MILSTRQIQVQFDVIVLTYNNFTYTKQCIENLYQHTQDFGIMIFDNASTDETVPYLKELSKNKSNISIFLSDKNIGVVSGRCRAFEMLYKDSPESPYVCFLDNDQFVQGGWSESYLNLFSRYDLVGFEGWKMRDDFYPYRKVKKGESYNYVGCGGMMLKKSVIQDIGLFDERFNPMFYEDPDYCWRALDKNYKICWDYEEKIEHQNHKLLGKNNERAKFFRRSWQLFKNKWKNHPVPEIVF